MRALLLLTLASGCVATHTSPYFTGLGEEAKNFVARSAPQASWTCLLATEPEGAGSAPLPGIQTLAFETDRTLDDAEVNDLIDRLEFEIVRALFKAQLKLVARHDRKIEPSTRAVSWEYDAYGRRGFLVAYGVRRERGYDVIINICEIGVDS